MDAQTASVATQVEPMVMRTLIVFGVIMIREMIWKGIALWKSWNKKQLARFICIFIFNTAGILPIIYLAFFQKKEKKEKK